MYCNFPLKAGIEITQSCYSKNDRAKYSKFYFSGNSRIYSWSQRLWVWNLSENDEEECEKKNNASECESENEIPVLVQ